MKKNTAYLAETEEEAEMLCLEAHRQGYKWKSGKSFLSSWRYSGICFNITEGLESNKQYYEKNKYKIVPVKEFFNQLNTKIVGNKFPFKLNRIEANEIINVACGSWKERLAREWFVLLYEESIQITEEFYKE